MDETRLFPEKGLGKPVPVQARSVPQRVQTSPASWLGSGSSGRLGPERRCIERRPSLRRLRRAESGRTDGAPRRPARGKERAARQRPAFRRGEAALGGAGRWLRPRLVSRRRTRTDWLRGGSVGSPVTRRAPTLGTREAREPAPSRPPAGRAEARALGLCLQTAEPRVPPVPGVLTRGCGAWGRPAPREPRPFLALGPTATEPRARGLGQKRRRPKPS